MLARSRSVMGPSDLVEIGFFSSLALRVDAPGLADVGGVCDLLGAGLLVAADFPGGVGFAAVAGFAVAAAGLATGLKASEGIASGGGTRGAGVATGSRPQMYFRQLLSCSCVSEFSRVISCWSCFVVPSTFTLTVRRPF